MSKTQDEATNRQVLALQNHLIKALSRYMPSSHRASELLSDPTPISLFRIFIILNSTSRLSSLKARLMAT
jgi:hypothetical protein